MSEEAPTEGTSETPSENFTEAKRKAIEKGRASKSPIQKRAEAEAKRKEWTQEEIDAALVANGGTPKGSNDAPGRAGRPSKYPTIDLERVEMYAAGGLTKLEIAESLNISYDTLREYEKGFPEFSEAIAKGRRRDVEEVENAMHRMAKGYAFTEDKIFYDSQVGKVVIQPTLKRIPPDVKAGLAVLQHAETGSWRPKGDPAPSPDPIEPTKKVITMGGVRIEVG